MARTRESRYLRPNRRFQVLSCGGNVCKTFDSYLDALDYAEERYRQSVAVQTKYQLPITGLHYAVFDDVRGKQLVRIPAIGGAA